MKIIPNETLREKRLQRLMGEDYYCKPALRLVLGKLEGIQRVEDMDGGRNVEWDSLETEREQKIAIVYFWRGVEQAKQWAKEGYCEPYLE